MEELILLQEHIPKLLLAALIGGIIGLERGNRGGVIGFGTLSTLTLGCTLLTIISAYAIGTDADPSRLISTIISSIGFIGGGVIFTQRNDNEQSVRGLTSASIVFCLAAIGISIGLGYYGIAIVTAILIELNVLISRFIKKRRKENEEDDDSEF